MLSFLLESLHCLSITEQEAMVVKQIADSGSIAPTEAANQASVMENCQGWAIHVIARLVECHPTMKWEMAKSMTLDTA